MAKIKVTVNASELAKELARSGGITLEQQVEKEARDVVEKNQKKAINEFKTHPVVREIKAGPNSSNTSELLGGYGNLYSYLGFTDSDPTQPVLDKLEEDILVRAKGRFFGVGKFFGKFNVEVDAPTLDDLEDVSPMEWTSQSWIDAIEHGIGGGGAMGFFWRKKGGRSGGGVQTENDKGREAETSPFMSSILNRFKERIERGI